MTLGENVLDGSLEVNMEEVIGTNETKIKAYRIIPRNPFKRYLHSRFELTWTYSNSDHEKSHIGMILTTENNSIPCIKSDLNCDEDLYNDGSIKDILLRPSDAAWVFVSPEKHLYLKEMEKCRERPYNEDSTTKMWPSMRERAAPQTNERRNCVDTTALLGAG